MTEHNREVLKLDEGEEVTLVLDDGSEVDVTVDEKSRHNDERGRSITEQKKVTFTRSSDGAELGLAVTDGISGIEGESPFPTFFPLHEHSEESSGRIPDENVLGYVEEIRGGSGVPEDADWTIEAVRNQPGYSVARLAAYRCRNCGNVVPCNFVREQDEPPEELPNHGCGEIWGGCGEWGAKDLVGDGWVHTED